LTCVKFFLAFAPIGHFCGRKQVLAQLRVRDRVEAQVDDKKLDRVK
jgi:hypothetical protein